MPSGGTIIPEELLDVPYFEREETNWCWAGCCEMVFHFFGINRVSQCEMADFVFQNDCCQNRSACNLGLWPDPVLDHWGIRFNTIEAALTFQQVHGQLVNGSPVLPYYLWSGGGISHLALIRGNYVSSSSTQGDLEVNDPSPSRGQGRFSHLEILTAYGMGSWKLTYRDVTA